MMIDGHYYLTRVLAEKAGFSPQDAQTIAYADQFVDDAVGFARIKISGKIMPYLDGVYTRQGDSGGIFDPATTAHENSTYFAGPRQYAQRRTYIPFHFLPPRAYRGAGDGDYSYRTQPNGELARGLVNAALSDITRAAALPEAERALTRTRELIGLGIALHSYADTWSHQQFSGRFSAEENGLDDVHVKRDGEWVRQADPHGDELKNFIGTPIGHARAGINPDKSYLEWKYTSRSLGPVIRDNRVDFMAAAEAIFTALHAHTGGSTSWSDIADRIKDCIEFHTPQMDTGDDAYCDLKARRYVEKFPEISFAYDKWEWRKSALTGDWADFLRPESMLARMVVDSYPEFKFAGDHRWFFFHFKANAQRDRVLAALKPWEDDSDAVSYYKNIGDIFETNLPQLIDRKFGPVIDVFLPVPTKVEEKGRWVGVTVRNATPYVIEYTGDVYFEKGKYWPDAPARSIRPFSKHRFVGCNSDRAVAGVSAAGKYLIQVGATSVPVTIAFTHPLASSFASGVGGLVSGLRDAITGNKTESEQARKCWAKFADDVHWAHKDVDDGPLVVEKEITHEGQTLRLRLESSPGSESVVTLTLA
jgi:hypothetical protein